MVFMKWNDSLSVKVKEIDEQHKNLVEIVNKIYECKDSKKISNLLNELVEFTRVHFSTEENYFEKYNYPDKEHHMDEHANLIEKVLHFKDKLDAGQDIIEEFLTFLKEWLEIHLKTTDHDYVAFFQKMGLK